MRKLLPFELVDLIGISLFKSVEIDRYKAEHLRIITRCSLLGNSEAGGIVLNGFSQWEEEFSRLQNEGLSQKKLHLNAIFQVWTELDEIGFYEVQSSMFRGGRAKFIITNTFIRILEVIDQYFLHNCLSSNHNKLLEHLITSNLEGYEFTLTHILEADKEAGFKSLFEIFNGYLNLVTRYYPSIGSKYKPYKI